MAKIVTMEQALEQIWDDQVLMIGGFLAVGTPEILVDGIVEKNVRNLTIIANDTGYPDRGIGKLITAKQVKKIIISHIGTNPETGRQMNAEELTVELVPQGTLAEQIRAGGAGLGGVITPTGLGTIVEKGKQKVTVDHREYLIEKPLKADVALLQAAVADKAGNLMYHRSSRNFNPLMAMAAQTVIVAVNKIVGIGELDPDQVMTPGIFIDMIVQG